MDQEQQNHSLVISEISLSELASIRKWAFFLAIMGFIGSAFMIIFGLFFGAMSKFVPQEGATNKFPVIIMMLFYFIIGIIYIFPSMLLFNFSSKIKMALATHSESPFAEALNYLRLLFKFTGIMVIICILFVLLGIIIAVLLAFFAASHAGI